MHLSTLQFMGWLALSSVVASSDPTMSTCKTLSVALPDEVFFPETDSYNASVLSYPFVQLRLESTCIVRPKTTHDVVTIITTLNESNRTRFAIKGGGHNANVGFNNIRDGVTIDMQGLKTVEVARGNEVVRVGAGALGQDVYDVVQKHNLTILGPRIGMVGVAGFTTGGGIGFLSPEKGWACDAVVNFEVVLASGEIVNANATSRVDLYTALKGGQSNFGTVTRFDLKTFPQGPIWGGRIAYAANASAGLISAYTKFKDPENYDPYASGWVTIGYNHTVAKFAPVSILWYTKPQLKPGALGGIINAGSHVTNGMIEAPINEHTRNASRGVAAAAARRTIWATTTFHISPTILHRIHSFWADLIPEICETHAEANVAAELTFQSLPPSPSSDSHPNSLGFAHNETPEKNIVFVQVVFLYSDGAATVGLEKALKDLVERINELADDEGLAHKFRYMNFAAWFQNPLGGYGKKQKKTLREVAQKYDPKGMFQKQLAGGFKLF
ncbi:FAD-binding domain-containing protein [Dothidotthia symphoricarpi CBS 119687]|uniref:FAD-binding domain-containing protein n=1 Tax=Dothidotthia symphoricarpi CBS 119687 TaxID=1392245 RepID=A0A6A6ADL0_9PLEO|nr:FAD-binding domain-containing protein [Dothidotthia symphoricarpi CBS 119687]KAF2129353.1 FAD-binding domain-containing protein [Dothidotthia symphoricarpi CBS 119687]